MIGDIKEIICTAKRYKACESVMQIDDLQSAIRVLLSPQGREFAINTKYPSLQIFRENKEILNAMNGIFIDAGKVKSNCHEIVVVGDTELTVNCHGVDAIHHIVAMHGAKVCIKADMYAVVTVAKIDADIEILNDNTAIINIEQ